METYRIAIIVGDWAQTKIHSAMDLNREIFVPNQHNKFLLVEDLPNYFVLSIEAPDGSTRTVQIPKRLKLWAPENYPRKILKSIVCRDFNFDKPRDLVFEFDLWTGLGDIFIACSVIHSLRTLLQKRKRTGFRFIGSANKERFGSLPRFFEKIPIFDDFVESHIIEKYPFINEPLVLHPTPGMVHPSFVNIGSAWECLWAKWGLPGKYHHGSTLKFQKILANSTEKEFEGIRSVVKFPDSGSYILICPESSLSLTDKTWPIKYWQDVIRWILMNTKFNVVVLGSKPLSQTLIVDDPRVTNYNLNLIPNADVLKLAVVVNSARAVVGLDSSAAHIAGFLQKPCITLFGPTAPVIWGNPNNVNIRLSTCPPCNASIASSICKFSACLYELTPDYVVMAMTRVLKIPLDN